MLAGWMFSRRIPFCPTITNVNTDFFCKSTGAVYADHMRVL